MVESQAPSEYYVDPISGEDSGTGDRAQPYKTLTYALQQINPDNNAVIRLQPGRYDAESGEHFPIVIPAGVLVVGNVPQRGEGVLLVGSGRCESPIFGQQQATIALTETAQVRGITITNPIEKGTGIWVETVNATIAHCTLVGCGREGVLVSGEANPVILNCRFEANSASGITFTRYAKGEVQRNLFLKNRFGITLSDFAAPLLANNEVMENRVGLVVSGSAYPVLRHNWIANNLGDGITVFANARLDLGDRQSPAGNLFRDNREFDLRNLNPVCLISVGNQLHPLRVQGAIALEGIQPVVLGAVKEEGTQSKRGAELLQPDVTFDPEVDPPDISGHWALPFIQAVLAKRVMGCFADGTFKPERQVSRAQFATVLARAFQLPDRFLNPFFLDVPAEYWAAGAIAQAVRMGFLTGFPDQKFCPESIVTRLTAIAALVQGLELQGGQLDLLQGFLDRVQIPSQMAQTVAVALQHRLIGLAQTDRLNPLAPASRAELAVWIVQALVLRDEISAIESPYLVRSTVQQLQVQQPSRRTPLVVLVDLYPNGDLSPSSPDGSICPDALGALAQQIATLLEMEGVQVKLTRAEYETADLDTRSSIAEQANADLMISLYGKATQPGQAKSSGITTYYNPNPASSQVAQTFHTAILRSIDLPDQGVKPANFDRFSHLSIPVIHLDLGFLVGADNSLVGGAEAQRYLAAAIVRGILQAIKTPLSIALPLP